MARKVIDCREYPSEMNCTLALSADSEDELIEAACQHAVAVHKHADTPELRVTLRSTVRAEDDADLYVRPRDGG
jgi:predicted small metal-binding protein